jgi:hypothetical protein
MKKLFLMATMLLSFGALNAQSKIKLGSYIGSIEISGKLTNINTNIENTENNIKGNYAYGSFSGKLINCKLEAHTLTCNWMESETSTGNFKAIFNDDYSSFNAVWSYSNGNNGGAWFATRK